MTKILIVEDNADLAKGLELNLKKEGYQVLKAATGEEAIRLAIRDDPGLIIMDVMLPGISGMDVCRELRRKEVVTPIIMLTAKSDELDRVLGLELGADDYMVKPFGLRELLARIRVCLRRQPSQLRMPRYRFGKVEIDFEKYTVTVCDKQVEMTQKEFELLRFLIHNRESVLTRERLLNEVWGYDSYPSTRTVDTHMLKLRKKIEENPSEPKYIISVYGGGYKFLG
ncbi:MAG TPA: response regulator transcription factor [Acidobacteriota bacterium]|nr:response regulator transcription factor [Acidobacteriota bacterium]